jgi:hypothetical protein
MTQQLVPPLKPKLLACNDIFTQSRTSAVIAVVEIDDAYI